MGMFSYVTNRTLPNKAGQETGRIKAFVKHGSGTIEGEYTCPECKASGKISQAFTRPLAIRCAKCGFILKLPKLKGKK